MIAFETQLVEINESLQTLLPETYRILKAATLTVHPYVYRVILEGSRGLARCYRDDSDIDLSLLVDMELLAKEVDQEKTLREILDITLNNWSGPVELDTAAIFDINGCRLHCIYEESGASGICPGKGIDCFGLYKIQRGFDGYVPKIGVRIELIYPLITVWKR